MSKRISTMWTDIGLPAQVAVDMLMKTVTDFEQIIANFTLVLVVSLFRLNVYHVKVFHQVLWGDALIDIDLHGRWVLKGRGRAGGLHVVINQGLHVRVTRECIFKAFDS